MAVGSRQDKFGSLQRDLPFVKDVIDYQLTRYPRLYLFVEQFREWVNWDKRVYLSFVRPGDNVLDIGANVGAHSVFLSHLVRGEGSVLAFEPLEPNVEGFRETLRRRSRIDNIRVLQRAVGASPTTQDVTIAVPGNDFTQASLKSHTAGSWRENAAVREYRVALTSIDSEIEVQSLAHLDFVKIDVEGGELNVLKGAARTLSTHLPMIYSELYDRWTASFGYAPADVFDFVRSLGYEEARVISGGRVRAMSLSDAIPSGLFSESSDVLFLAARHQARLWEFDRRYRVPAISR
jgi:FkbM family methyltransferase